MAIYIQSRGKSQDNDYRWLKIEPDRCYPKNPDFLLQSIGNLNIRPVELIESQKFSLILVSTSQQFYLLVTGLKAREERIDFTGRQIRNSLLWVCPQNESAKIRSLVVLALQDKLESELDLAISSTGKYGFEVNCDRLKELPDLIATKNNSNTDLKCKIGKNSDNLKQEIAVELENSFLPEREGLLILITSIKSASALKKTNVWRGLSNRIVAEDFQEYSTLVTRKHNNQKKTIFWLMAIILISIILISLIIFKLTIPSEITPNSLNLKDSNTSLKDGNYIELPLTCQEAKDSNYFLSPCL